ncbi:MAG TPA: RpiB/LacA/LacB family sugar-phosphate isomerase [Actinomycetes bacterium]
MAAIAAGADNAGAPLKEHLARYLQERGYEVKDYGNAEYGDYPDVAAEVAEAVGRGAHDSYSAERARKANDAQVRTMGARVIVPQAAEKVLDHWLASEFEGGGSAPKVAKMQAVVQRHRARPDDLRRKAR